MQQGRFWGIVHRKEVEGMSSNNKSFFKNAKEGQMSLGDIFSDVTRKHTKEEADTSGKKNFENKWSTS